MVLTKFGMGLPLELAYINQKTMLGMTPQGGIIVEKLKISKCSLIDRHG